MNTLTFVLSFSLQSQNFGLSVYTAFGRNNFFFCDFFFSHKIIVFKNKQAICTKSVFKRWKALQKNLYWNFLRSLKVTFLWKWNVLLWGKKFWKKKFPPPRKYNSKSFEETKTSYLATRKHALMIFFCEIYAKWIPYIFVSFIQ